MAAFRTRADQRISWRSDILLGGLGLAALGIIWCFLTYGGIVSPIFLPSPSELGRAFVEFAKRGWLAPAIARSTLRVTVALTLVTVIGVPLGLAMGTVRPLDAILRRPISAAKSVPITGLMGLIVLWFSVEERAKITFLFLGAIFYIVILTRNAALTINAEFIDVAADLGAKRYQLLWYVILPAALPHIWEAITVSNGLMWTYILLAEFINSSEDQLGIGYLLYIGTRTQSAGMVFAALLLIALISAATDGVFRYVRKRLIAW